MKTSTMKKFHLALAGIILAAGITACNSGENTTATTTTSSTDSLNNTNSQNNNTSAGTTATTSRLPLNAQDSTFVMKAAMSSIMEVESGTVAQQNAQHERVKAFAAMMVKDHRGANQELMGLVGGRGMNIPSTLPPDTMKHMTSMQKMQGKAFDKHCPANAPRFSNCDQQKHEIEPTFFVHEKKHWPGRCFFIGCLVFGNNQQSISQHLC
jgi:putative membrane protein